MPENGLGLYTGDDETLVDGIQRHYPEEYSGTIWTVRRIISGGQTGADRAALEWAIAHNVPHSGWCPAGRHAEDGCIAPRFHLQETPSEDNAQRTAWNVRDADGTVVLSLAPHLSGGSLLTIECAAQYHKPFLHLHRGDVDGGTRLAAFLMEHRIGVLNVAGPRASEEPGIGVFVCDILEAAWREHALR